MVLRFCSHSEIELPSGYHCLPKHESSIEGIKQVDRPQVPDIYSIDQQELRTVAVGATQGVPFCD